MLLNNGTIDWTSLHLCLLLVFLFFESLYRCISFIFTTREWLEISYGFNKGYSFMIVGLFLSILVLLWIALVVHLLL
jgi:hypothetical protein